MYRSPKYRKTSSLIQFKVTGHTHESRQTKTGREQAKSWGATNTGSYTRVNEDPKHEGPAHTANKGKLEQKGKRVPAKKGWEGNETGDDHHRTQEVHQGLKI